MNEDPLGSIWITSRVRMGVHGKFIRWDRISHILLTAYSVALLGFSIFEPHLQSTKFGPYSFEISILLSLSILCTSLVVWGLGLNNKARDHRDCYLALQKLYTETISNDEKISKYQEILERHPNHSELDYERFLFRKIWIEGVTVSTTGGPSKMSKRRALIYLIKELLWVSMISTIILFPAIIVYILYAL